MSGVYGSFVEAFAELNEKVSLWTLDDKSDMRQIVGVFIPQQGNSIKRRKYTSGNTGLDIVGEDDLYISGAFAKSVAIGDYCTFTSKEGIYRVTNIVDYIRPGGYFICNIQLVSGTTTDMTEQLDIKEGRY